MSFKLKQISLNLFFLGKENLLFPRHCILSGETLFVNERKREKCITPNGAS